MKRKIALLLAVLLTMAMLPSPAIAEEDAGETITFATAPVDDPYEGLPLFDGVPEHVDAYLDVYLDYIGLDGMIKYALDQRGDYQLRSSATFSSNYEIVSLRGVEFSWDQPNAGRRIPGCALFYEGVQGVSTNFPCITGMGQTWNKGLVNRIGTVIGNEKLNTINYNASSGQNRYMSAINFSVCTITDVRNNPLSGRIDEGYSEDPYLASMMVLANTSGVTGINEEANDDGFWTKAFTDGKHFSSYTTQWMRLAGSNYAGPRALTEYQAKSTYKGFAAGSLTAIMTSYGRTNSIPNAISPMINYVKNISRYGIYTLSDNGAEVRMFANNAFGNGYEARYTVSRNDQLLWQNIANNSGGHQQDTTYPAIHDNHIGVIYSVLNGKYGVSYDELARVAKSQIMTLIRNGILNERDENNMPKNYPFISGAANQGGTMNSTVPEHQDVALAASEECIVLLKNNNLLPLSKSAPLAVAGQAANTRWTTTYTGSQPTGANMQLTPVAGIAAAAGITAADLGWSTATSGTSGKIVAIKAANGKYLSVDTDTWAVTATADTVEEATKFEVYAWGQANSVSLRYAGVSGTDATVRFLTNAASVACSTTATITGNTPPAVLIREDAGNGKVRFVSNAFSSGFGGGFETTYYTSGRFINLTDDTAGTLSQTNTLSNLANANSLRTDNTAFEIVTVKEAGADVTVTPDGVAIVVLGVSPRFTQGEGSDRIDLDLGKEQYELAHNVAAKYPGKTVVIIKTSAPVIVDNLAKDNNIGAIVYQPFGGQYDGYAMGRILFGDAAPTGRLTNTWYASMQALPKMTPYVIGEGVVTSYEGIGPHFSVEYTNADPASARLTYMYSDAEITYPFGYGLSYSEFSLRDLTAPDTVSADAESFNVSLKVANIGGVATSDVVQLYITHDDSPYGDFAPKKQLVSFDKVFVDVAASEDAVLTVEPKDFAVWNTVKNEFSVLPGTYTISAGHSSDDILLTKQIEVTGEELGTLDPTSAIDVFAASFATSNVIYREVSRQGTMDSLRAGNVTNGFWSVMSKQAGAWTAMKNVDLSGQSHLTLTVATNKSAGNIEVRLDAPDGPLAATVPVPVTSPVTYDLRDSDTGDFSAVSVTELSYTDVTVPYDADGVHDVYLVFSDADLRVSTLKISSITFPTAPAGDPYEGLPLFDGVPEHVDAYLDVYLDYIGLDGILRYALDQRGDYLLRNEATYSNNYATTALRGKTVTWDNPNAGKVIPGGTRFTDSVQGVSTDFPSVIGMGQTWNKQLVYNSGTVLGNEALNRNQYYSNLTSTTNNYLSAFNGMAATALTDTRINPLAGRIDEGYAEDPFMVGVMSTAMGHGTGGTDLPESQGGFWQKVFVTTKHYTNYIAEWMRRDGNNFASIRAQMEYQGRGAFKGFSSGAFGGVLTTYGRTNGVPDVISPLIKYVKGISPYDFYTVPDNQAENRLHVANTFGNGYMDRYVPEWSDQFLWMMYANAAGALCNTTNNLPGINDNHIRMIDDVLNGKYGIVKEDTYDAAKGQIMQLIRCGVLNERDENGIPKNYPFAGYIYQNTEANTAGGTHNSTVQDYRDIALQTAQESAVLLKNNGVLPLSKTADIVITGGVADTRYKTMYSATTPNGPNMGLSALGGIAAVVNGTDTSAETRDIVAQYKADGTYISGGKIIRIKASNGKYFVVNDAGNAVTATGETADDATMFEVYAWGQANSASMRVVGETGSRASLNGRWLANGATVNTVAGNFDVSGMTSGFASANTPPGTMIREYQADGSVRYISSGVPSGFFDNEHSYYNSGRYMSLSDASAGTLAQTTQLGNGTASGVGSPAINAEAKRTEATLFTEEIVKEPGEAVISGEYAIVIVGNACRYSSGEGADRIDLDMGKEQYDLVANISAKYPGKTVVILKTSEPLIMKQIQENPNVAAILYQPYAGEYDGLGLAQILFGEATPTGRLTHTWYAGMEALPAITPYVTGEGVAKNVGSTGVRQLALGDNLSPYWTVEYTDADPAGTKLTYMYTDAEVTYEFGYGLSYSNFAYSNLVTPPAVNGDGPFTVTVDVTNTGAVDTAEVVQLYISAIDSPYGSNAPKKQMVSFEKVFIPSGESKTVLLTVDPKDFAVWNTNISDFTVLSGDYTLSAGKSSKNIVLSQPLAVVAGEISAIDVSSPVNVYAKSFATSNVIYSEISRQGTMDNLKNNELFEGYYSVVSKQAGAWTAMKNIDLSGSSHLTLAVATNKAAGNIEIRLDAPDGPLAATVPVPVTDPVTYDMRDSAGASNTPVSVTELSYTDVTVPYNATGIHDVYLVFSDADLRVSSLRISSVIVSLKYTGFTNLVSDCAANVPVEVVTENADGLNVKVGLYLDGELKTQADVNNGKATLRVGAYSFESASIKAWIEGSDESVKVDIPVKTIAPTLWEPTMFEVDGKVTIVFVEKVGLAASKSATVRGAKATGINIPEDYNLEISGYGEAVSGNQVVVSGVKYPELFPSYSFTFTLNIT